MLNNLEMDRGREQGREDGKHVQTTTENKVIVKFIHTYHMYSKLYANRNSISISL